MQQSLESACLVSLLPVLASLPGLASGCSDDGTDTTGAQCEPARELSGDTPLPAEVDAVLEAHCRECHTDPPQNYAPMPLLSWEDVHTLAPARSDGSAVYERMAKRIHDARFPMPPKTRDALDEESRATLDAWIAQCAPPAEN